MKVYTTKIPPVIWVLIGIVITFLLMYIVGRSVIKGYEAGQAVNNTENE